MSFLEEVTHELIRDTALGKEWKIRSEGKTYKLHFFRGRMGVCPPLKGREDTGREAATSVLHEADSAGSLTARPGHLKMPLFPTWHCFLFNTINRTFLDKKIKL